MHRYPSHNSTISNSMIDQGRLETNLLKLFAHAENSKCFSIISIINFEVNVVAAKRMTIMSVLLH